MKLVAKAKPVKIRIKSGGKEHSSLDSLKMNFCIDDVRELLDGRLSRWLRQQNEILLAEEIDKFESRDLIDSDEKCLEFINLLFYKELETINITSLFDLAKHWCIEDIKYKRNGKSLFKQRLLEYNLEAAKYAYKTQLFPEEHWIGIFTIFRNSKDAEYLYILGKLWFDGYDGVKDIENGYKLIKEAAAYGWEEAIKFEKDKVYQKATDRFYGVNKEKIKNYIIDRWPYQLIKADYRYASNEKEKEIIQFIFKCKDLFQNYNQFVYLNATGEFNNRKDHFLEYEMRTIVAFLDGNLKKELGPIKDIYPPATCLYYQKNTVNGMQLAEFKNSNSKYKIKYIVQHLFDFE